MVLSQEEIDGCRDAFSAFDKDRSGSIDMDELKLVLQSLGQNPTEEELIQMISEVDANNTGSIGFSEFLQVIEKQKQRAMDAVHEGNTLDAFVACGGDQDKAGFISKESLLQIIKNDFGLTIDIEDLINKIDVNESGEVGFDDFRAFLGPMM